MNLTCLPVPGHYLSAEPELLQVRLSRSHLQVQLEVGCHSTVTDSDSESDTDTATVTRTTLTLATKCYVQVTGTTRISESP